MSEIYTILFNSGQQSGAVEAKIAPLGTLSKVTNLVQEKNGKWVKRKEYRQLSSNGIEKPILAIGQRNSDKIVVTDQPARLYNYDTSTESLVTFGDGYIGLPSFTAPERAVVENSLDHNILRSDTAATNGYVATVYQEENTIKVKLFSAETKALLREQVILDDENLVAFKPQIVANSRYMVIFFMQTALDICTVREAVLDTEDSGIPSFSAQTQVALAEGLWGPLCGIATCVIGESVFVVFQSEINMLRILKMEAPFSTYEDLEITDGVNTGLQANIWGSEVSNRIWITWRRTDIDAIRVCSSTLTDFENADEPVLRNVSTDSDNISRPSIVGYSYNPDGYGSHSVMLAWNGYDITDGPHGSRINYCIVDDQNPPEVGPIHTWEGVNFFANLMAGERGINYEGNEHTNEVFVFGFGDSQAVGSGSDPQTRNYQLLRLDIEGTGSKSSVVQLQLGDQLAPNMQLMVAESSYGHVASYDGYYYFSAPIVFRGLSNTTDAGVGISLYAFEKFSRNRCQPTKHGSNLYFTGGIVSKYDGHKVVEAGFLRAPDIFGADGYESDDGELTLLGTYTYAVVYERVDNDNGNVIRSGPSFFATTTLTGDQNSIELGIRDLKVRQNTNDDVAHVHIYRSRADGSTLFRITPETGMPTGGSLTTAGHIIYLDELADEDIDDSQILYTQVGGTLANYPPPPCRYMFSCLPRLWCLGLEDNEMVECSKEYFHGEEPAQFTRHPAFRLHMPGKVLGGGALRSNPVVFTRDKIVLITGEGPNDSGEGTFRTEVIPSDSGLVEWGHRAIIETNRGLVFQAQDNRIDLITTGYEPPITISEPVRDILEEFPYVTSSVLVNEERELRFTCTNDLYAPSDGVILNYDLDDDRWSVRDDGYYTHATIWDGAYALGKDNTNFSDSLVIEQNTYENTGVMCIETADFYAAVNKGPGNSWLRCRKIAPLFEYLSPCFITVEYSIDGGVNWVNSGEFQLDDENYESGEAVTIWFHVATQKSDRIRVRLKCFTDGGESFQTGRGVAMLGLSMEMRAKGGPKRVGAVGRR